MKKKNILIIFVAILVIVLLGLFSLFGRLWFRNGYMGLRDTDLEANFYSTFLPQDPADFGDITVIKDDNCVVYLCSNGGHYCIYNKLPLVNLWTRIDSGSLDQITQYVNKVSGLLDGCVYLSKNTDGIVEVVTTKNGSTTKYSVDPQKPMAIITEDDLDQITFRTKSGEELSEAYFLETEYEFDKSYPWDEYNAYML
jgi:hypothetical protein